MRQVASGSFYAVDVRATGSSETRIVAGRLTESTNVAGRSAWVLVKMPRDRSKISTINATMKTYRDRGIAVDEREEQDAVLSARDTTYMWGSMSEILILQHGVLTKNGTGKDLGLGHGSWYHGHTQVIAPFSQHT